MYQALYRKYRPQTFDEVVGQNGVTQTLKMQLQTNKLSHAYLFTGSRGTGKTSCAKILAKAVNCEQPVDGNPCNHCAACRAIDSGACMDVLEIDAASNNGVDHIRGLRDDAVFPPAEVQKRVYIIDEVHMLSMSAFNALLKTIEEPPPHLLFILATTELQKVPATILSRCQRFSFRRLTPEDIASRINECAWRENIEIDEPAISLLSRLADGALRDGMSLLDQCASAISGPVTADSVYRCLGLAGAKQTVAMLQCVAQRDAATLLAHFTELYAAGKDLGAMIDELTALCRDLLILKTAPGDGTRLISGVCSRAELDALLPCFPAAALLRMTQLLQQTASGFRTSANRRIDAELCLIRLCDESLSTDPVSLAARLSRLEQLAQTGALAAPVPNTAPVIEALAEKAPAKEAAKPSSPAPHGDLWARICTLLRPQIGIDKRAWLLSSETDGSIVCKVQAHTLRLLAKTIFDKGMLDRMPELLQQAAAQLLGPETRVVSGLQDGEHDASDSFAQLASAAKQHPELVHIQK